MTSPSLTGPPDSAHGRREADRVRNSSGLLSTLLDSVGIPIALSDPAGRIVLLNRACEDLTGFASQTCRGRTFWDLVLEGGEAEEWRQAVEARSSLEGRRELSWRIRNGSRRRVLTWILFAGREGGVGPYVMTLGVDVTELRRLEERLGCVEEWERLKFGRDVHDGLGQVLTGILFACHRLEAKAAKGGRIGIAETRRLRGMALRAMRNARALAQGRSQAPVRWSDLGRHMKEMAAAVRDTFGIRCEVRWDGTRGGDGDAGASHVYWIVQEAVTNAVRHGKASRICIGAYRRNGGMLIRVQDDGGGLVEGRGNGGVGIDVMRSRAKAVGAVLSVSNRSRGGVRVDCRWPLPRDSKGRHP